VLHEIAPGGEAGAAAVGDGKQFLKEKNIPVRL